jgi:hypothetical protein
VTFSKKIENYVAAVALHYMWYNIVRVHQTLRVTPALEAAISSTFFCSLKSSGCSTQSTKKQRSR